MQGTPETRLYLKRVSSNSFEIFSEIPGQDAVQDPGFVRWMPEVTELPIKEEVKAAIQAEVDALLAKESAEFTLNLQPVYAQPEVRSVRRELVLRAARESGLVRTYSCCGVEDKFCATDQWKGNLEGFANALLRLEMNG